MKKWHLTLIYGLVALLVLSALARLAGMGAHLTTGEAVSPDNQHYLSHLSTSLLHLIPGSLFVLLAPLQFNPRIRQRYPAYHRRAGYLLWLCGLIAAGTGLWMNLYWPPVGGWVKWVSSVFFAAFVLLALIIALIAILKRNLIQHRQWMIRAFAVSLGVASMRVIMIPYFLLFGMPSSAVIDTVTLAGFLINALLAEAYIRRHPNP